MSYSKLTLTKEDLAGDMSFEEYNARQLYEISPERNHDRAFSARAAGKFFYNEGAWTPGEYEGFAVVSMLSENPENEPLETRLIEIQKELQYHLLPRYAFYYLPPESFHQTIANTLSGDRFKRNILEPGLEESYPGIVKNAFNKIPLPLEGEPIRMRMAGLSIFGTAIGILGVIDDEDDYNRITDFRKSFYGNRTLAKLDVKMTRPFIGHITLAYVEHSPNKNQKEYLSVVISEINEMLEKEHNYFYISQTGLTRYHHLAEFIKQDNYPTHLI
ncbi:MAG TPA: hypothetical protein VHS53_06805 [Mucilaginibacter sp.]|jgi:hypothetical protein|nr:hypothetical protein [Mucilaginibacter sp.]